MTHPRLISRVARLGAIAALLLSAACGVETIVQDLNEREVNLIIEALADSGITAEKLRLAEGREVVYAVTVASSVRLDAIRVLNQNELPRRRDKGYLDVYAESGLIPTSAEERAKKLAAIEGEIERQLKLIQGILDAQVQIVMPEESALRTTQEAAPQTTSAVTIKYMPDGQGRAPLGEQQVRALVANGVEKLSPENVFVVLTPAVVQRPATPEGRMGTWAGKLTPKQLTTVTVLIVGLMLVLCLIVVFMWTRLQTVRGRFLRLQGEIAKARRKQPAEGTPAPGA